MAVGAVGASDHNVASRARRYFAAGNCGGAIVAGIASGGGLGVIKQIGWLETGLIVAQVALRRGQH